MRSAAGLINAVSVYETGFPLQIYQTNLNSAYGYGAQRPNATGVAPGTSGSVEQRLYNYINPAAFSIAPAGDLRQRRPHHPVARSRRKELGYVCVQELLV